MSGVLGSEHGVSFLRIMQCGEQGGSRLMYQHDTSEYDSRLDLRALSFEGNGRLLGLAESYGGTNGWGWIFELIPGGTNHPPIPAATVDTQYAMSRIPFLLQLPETLFTEEDPGQTLKLTVHGLDSFGLSFDPTTRQLSGTPTYQHTNTIVVRATDDGVPPLSASFAFEMRVLISPRFPQGTARWTPDGFEGVVRGPAGRSAVVEATEDFSSWTPITNLELTGERQVFLDRSPARSGRHRHYRLRLLKDSQSSPAVWHHHWVEDSGPPKGE